MTLHPTLPHHTAATHDSRLKVAVNTAIKVKDVGKKSVPAAVETPEIGFSVSPKPGTYSFKCEQTQTLSQYLQHSNGDKILYIYLATNLWTVTLFPTFGKDQWLKVTNYYICR